MVSLLGPQDEMLRTIERAFPRLVVHARGNEVHFSGPSADIALAARLVDELLEIVASGQPINRDAVERSVGMLRSQARERPAEVLTQNIVSNRGRTIRPKTLGQKQYVDAIDTNTIVFGIGPAGTGKTYLAMAKAVAALQAKEVNRILLTRPAVEAGERLGFLPGTLTDKIDPYLRPLYDALHDMVDPESIPRLMAAGTIEVAPLAYMRGRAQPLDTQVLTPTGWRRFGDLTVGDLVIGSDGLPTAVIGVHPQGIRPVYRVTAQDGASTLACGEHLWTVRTKDDKRRGRWRTLRTDEMLGSLRRFHTHRYELPLVAPVEFVERPVPLHPYALGLLLGDGCLTTKTTPSFSSADPELIRSLQLTLDSLGVEPVHTGRYDYSLRRHGGGRGGVIVANPLTAVLRELDLAGTTSGTKFIPDSLKFNAPWIRYAVLQGLLDADGGPVVQAGRTCRIQYRTTSPRLRDDVVFLVRSLGGVAYARTRSAAKMRAGRAANRPVEHRLDSYVLDIRLPEGMVPFGLRRKRAAYDATGGGRPQRYIHSIEPAGEAETMCIQVAAADSLYVTEDLLLTHNTINDAFIILDEAQNTSPEQMKMFLTRLGFGSKMVVTGDVTQVDLPGGVRSGLKVVREILDGIEDVHFSELTAHDVVRHRLVGAIVDAYGSWDARQAGQREARGDRRRPERSRPREGMDPA
ncbi:MAG TPA: phosphate starvation-inducible protein PhoH [Intrasporangiaceae bacterium]|nr:phosphate starvation-inducible protein PhoH [Intrasporangiaceae bacterium]